ncbi:hypothetical protein ACHHYP_06284 [Achlya hypogyna]|uniref:Transmembrane protein n=1 Tax=Achlya hypogyna TaxID=1202772 RepID=A0A1V9YV43_ACHHY|nr:hypothetical protein ACHHYP_06284 [Achlya hypogyna]
MAKAAEAEVEALNVGIFQYLQFGQSDTPVHYSVAPIFNISDPAYGVFGWNYLSDWALGHREVVSFIGDSGAFTLVSASAIPSSFTPDALEIPTNLSLYCRLCIQYTTLMMAAVAAATCGYCLLARFWFESINVTELNRVGAVVWHKLSLLVTSGAHYLFDKKNWIGDDVWYLDAPSAFLTGLLSVCTAEATYVFDIKTWRCHRLERDVVSKGTLDAQRFKSAVPLVE